MKNKAMIACALVLYFFVGLSGLFPFPALFARTITDYPPDFVEGRDRVEVTVCRGLPMIYRFCRTNLIMMSGESPATLRIPAAQEGVAG